MNKHAKRLIALALCVMLLAGLAAQAFADGIYDEAAAFDKARAILWAHKQNPEDGLSEHELQQWQLIFDTVLDRLIGLADARYKNEEDETAAFNALVQYKKDRATTFEAAQTALFWEEWEVRNKYKQLWDDQLALAIAGHVSHEVEYAKGRETLDTQKREAKDALKKYFDEQMALAIEGTVAHDVGLLVPAGMELERRQQEFEAAVEKNRQAEADAVAALAAYEQSMYDQINGSLS